MYKIFINIICGIYFFLFAPSANGQIFKNINIEIEQDSIDKLESQPYSNEDVHGDFTIDGQTFDNVEIHYRGAFYLFTLINQGSLRNWKVKFSKENKLEDRREWNFNYENYIRQNLAYHVFRTANVPVVSSENVLLSVNGNLQGLYLKYEDPDNKDWLKNVFGDNDGDLYKAAFDQPGQPKYFADLTYLGADDEDYYLHYRKQTNKDGLDEFDYSSIRDFTILINQTPDNEFEQTILDNFDVEGFIEYMVISNFIANWDSYPFRPKNYFLYDNPEDGKWHFIPWDLDGTFQDYGNRNPIRTTGSIYHYFDGIAPYNNTPTEPLERPLIWRIMEIDKFRDKYCYEYKQAIDTYLSSDYLNGVIDSIALGVANNTSGQELNQFNTDVAQVRNFITDRLQNVISELNQCDVVNDPFTSTTEITNQKSPQLNVFPNPASTEITVQLLHFNQEEVVLQMTNLLGKTINIATNWNNNNTFTINTKDLATGQYFIFIKNNNITFTEKIIITK